MSQESHSLQNLLSQASHALTCAGIDDARREARLLASWSLGMDLSGLLTRTAMNDDELRRFEKAVTRRVEREPLAMIVEQTGFWTLDLLVSPATLVPRGDTETLIESLLRLRPERQAPRRILDFGTGTGCLLLAALSEYPQAFGIGIDRSNEAAALARRNAERNGLSARAAFVTGDWAQALAGTFDIILSNPPYIETDDIAGLMPEVSQYEPKRALDGGADGLTAYRALMAAFPKLLATDGIAIVELGQGQAASVSKLAVEAGLQIRDIRRDLGGIERALAVTHD
ncbi:modification methylase HemK [Neoasaia chiangmaiensis NBRC 101099]|uniref:Release factor glutamine methyltransferase n=1 Tax=Neoasaia chiangmaiensis TaxID=320497 RepID=A0A1U9KML5_9PROT|nr:peptide chain release factor N(5)-glutamine methyltransferase [Neoasaia chiangmaiensis]AQS87032.1 protein-(glutamine-N5) methyltransferase, release factor-specific [Neoasaia chiangmaiensis]GBR37874.1 modification methylase HemK [Neoasaia chiangmaiensis NBRC 101099]GEN15164.1 release factor glutamine methyltransferase [Neoasaia chiangmaiensis]